MIVDDNFAQELKYIISTCYNIGDLMNFEQIHLGSVNKSFIIRTDGQIKKKMYFFRKYNPGKSEKEIEFEHSVITHLNKKHFELVSGLIHTKDGKTFVNRNQGQDHFYAIFDILPGKDRYSWINPNCSKNDLKNAGDILAKFHNIIFDLKPDKKRCEPKIRDLMPVIAQNISNCSKKRDETPFGIYLHKKLDIILSTINQTTNIFLFGLEGCEYKDLVQMVIHCDYHPGNLKFQNNAITGLFDFDWSKVDIRCFDVALAITYFCAIWGGKGNSRLHMEKTTLFFNAYQKASVIGAGPLSGPELKYLPYMIKAANIYVINWVIQDFYKEVINSDPGVHIKYLKHYIRFLTWLEKKCNFTGVKKLFF
jgi:homoserine kinase type II